MNGAIDHGVYWQDGETQMSNLYLSILRTMGIEQELFADSTGPLSDSSFAGIAVSRGGPLFLVDHREPEIERFKDVLALHKQLVENGGPRP